MSNTPYSVLISGAGIAGPALAFWLQRFGFSATVMERAPSPRPGGQAVDIRGAAREVVELMRLLPAIRQQAVEERGFAFIDRHGKHMARMPVSAFDGEGIVAEIEILRGDLSRILYEATSNQVEYIFDDSIDSLDEEDDGVRVTFEHASSRRFDIVVGADGVHSRVRALAFGEESAFVHPLGAYTAYFSSPDHVDTEQWFVIYNAPGGKAVGVRPNRLNGTQVMFNFLSPPLRYDRRELAQQKQTVLDRFAGLEWEVPRLLAAMRAAPDFYFDVMAQVPHGPVDTRPDSAAW